MNHELKYQNIDFDRLKRVFMYLRSAFTLVLARPDSRACTMAHLALYHNMERLRETLD